MEMIRIGDELWEPGTLNGPGGDPEGAEKFRLLGTFEPHEPYFRPLVLNGCIAATFEGRIVADQLASECELERLAGAFEIWAPVSETEES